ncbi:MAG: DUF4290 domain-containing protein [Bacteroidaceae bacterium]|nr:DUF4290 domain-containing protein [Bacteroidaceae bacterium]
MKYNTQRDHLRMPEYGRAVQEMVMLATGLPDREERQRCAETVKDIMVNMFPELCEQPDHEELVWNHIAYISEYKLDVDYPCEITRLDDDSTKPEPIHYPQHNIKQRQYGHFLEESLHKLAEYPEGEERDELLDMIANQMKLSLFNWNKDSMDNEKIAQDIERYTQGQVQLDVDDFHFNAVQCLPKYDSFKKKKRK